MWKPWRSSARIRASGGAEPPESRRTGRENFHRPGFFSRAASALIQIVGTPLATLTASRSISSSRLSGSACGPGNTSLTPSIAAVWGVPHTAAMLGVKLVFPGPHADPESLLELIEREAVSVASGVPTIWISALAALEKNPGRWKFSRPVRLLSGGSAPPEALMRALDRHGFHIVHLWGMTETTPLGTAGQLKSYMESWPGEKKYEVRLKQGRPAPFVELRVMGRNGEAPWDGKTIGELEVRGPWVASSYYNAPEEQHRWTADGWFRTGDVASIDPEGYIKIVDRSKDLIKSGGEWISSVDLENALMGHPAVREAAVIAVAHPKWQERPLAVVVLRDEARATPEELRAFLAGKFAKWQLPEAFVAVKEIPRTSVGKFLKTKLREQFAGWKWES